MTTLPYLKCSMPSCSNTVGQHSKKTNKNKQVCSAHRTHRKNEVDKWKLNQGCVNKDGHYGFPCVCSVIIESATLDINHIDGNNNNRDPKNIEVLCKMCHTTATLRNEHHLSHKNKRTTKIVDTVLFTGLLETG
jgi:hypothetical protein